MLQAKGHGVALQLKASQAQRDVVGPSVEELVLQQQGRGRRVLRVAGLQGCVQDLVGQARA